MEPFLALVKRRLLYRSWRWGTKMQEGVSLIMSAVMAVAAVMHFVYYFAPPAYYVAHHGDVATARSVSFWAFFLFIFLCVVCVIDVVKKYRFLEVRYNFVRTLGQARDAH